MPVQVTVDNFVRAETARMFDDIIAQIGGVNRFLHLRGPVPLDRQADRAAMTRSMHTAIDDLGLDHLYVVHAGMHRFALADTTTAIPAAELLAAGLGQL